MLNNIGITTYEPSLYATCQTISMTYGIEFVKPNANHLPIYLLVLDQEKLSLIKTNTETLKPVYVDFCAGKMAYRKKTLAIKQDLLAKAVGIKKYPHALILDATAGLGQDGFLLACMGAKVIMLERNPILYLLLQDGLQRFAKTFPDAELDYELLYQDATQFLQSEKKFDVIYLDPMFPPRTKSALVKKEMQFLHEVVGVAVDSEQLFTLSLAAANYRVVVKRPLHAETLTSLKPSFCYKGKAVRYDVYTSTLAGGKFNQTFFEYK